MYKKIFLLLMALLFFVFCHHNTFAQPACGDKLSPVFGVTTESIENLDRLLTALQKIKEKCIPTLRVVFQPAKNDRDEEKTLNYYAAALEKIRGKDQQPKYAYILGLLVDSQNFYKYDAAQMSFRARRYADKLSDYVDVWEAGNEVNGDWVGWKKDKYAKKDSVELETMRISVGTRIQNVYNAIWDIYKNKGKTPRLALNLYFNDDNIDSVMKDGAYIGGNCLNSDLEKCKGECLHDYEMFTWARKYLKPQQNKLKFDYVLFSFYKDDCPHVQTNPDLWARIFAKLSGDFTVEGKSPKVGFGEVAPQCYCSKGRDGKPKKDDNDRRIDACCRPEQSAYVREYYQTLHRDIKAAIDQLQGKKPDYVGGFFYWYFYQDATDGSQVSNQVLNALVESAEAWK